MEKNKYNKIIHIKTGIIFIILLTPSHNIKSINKQSIKLNIGIEL